ncbi:small ribosomal subunit protein uS10m-like isoform X2 [Babylonia areolata]|uniref:small ribosomal subunit protein uS10m-like isoform X2 n=1 Tax=Babylonia areolata TaxID=304850 RepID=UPI003FD18130
MASTLFRLGHIWVTRAVCCKCGYTGQLARLGDTQSLKVVIPRFCLAKSPTSLCVAAQTYCTPTGEDTEEADDLYRQVTMEVKSHDRAVLKSYTQFVTMTANEFGLNLAKVFEPPKVIKRYTVLKSVHIYSKHMVQYEARSHFTVFELKHLTGSTADTFLEYIQRNLPEGMAMKVTKHRLEKIPDHLSPPDAASNLSAS